MFEGVSSHQWRAESSNRWRWSWGGPVSRRTRSSIRSSCSRRSFGQCSPPARCSLSPIEFSRSPARWWTCWSQTCSRRSRKPCSLFDSSRPDRSELSSWHRSTNPASANQVYVNSNVIFCIYISSKTNLTLKTKLIMPLDTPSFATAIFLLSLSALSSPPRSSSASTTYIWHVETNRSEIKDPEISPHNF